MASVISEPAPRDQGCNRTMLQKPISAIAVFVVAYSLKLGESLTCWAWPLYSPIDQRHGFLRMVVHLVCTTLLYYRGAVFALFAAPCPSWSFHLFY